MSTSNTDSVSKKRIAGLDGVKGFLSLKIALAHVGFFFAVSSLGKFSGVARELSFPVLLFAFGVGTGISKRRKPVWPLITLAVVYLVSAALNETYVDKLVASGLAAPGTHSMAGGFVSRLITVASLSGVAHYADFIQPYLLFLGLAVVFDRIGQPLRKWNPWLLAGSAIGLNLLGMFLAKTVPSGPLTVLWNGGYRSFQYAPLFVAGVLIGVYRLNWLATSQTHRGWALFSAVLKLCGVKVVEMAAIILRPHTGYTDALWRDGDYVAMTAGAICAILLMSAYGDIKTAFEGAITNMFEKVGRRTIISLSVQMALLPLGGLVALHFHSEKVRLAIGLGTFLLIAAIVLNWDRLAELFRKKGDLEPPEPKVEPRSDPEPALANA